MGVPGLDPGLAIIRRRLRDEAFLAGGSAGLMAVRRATTGRHAAITGGIRAGSGFSDSWRDSQIARTVRVLCSLGNGGGPWRELTAKTCVIV